MPQGLSATAQRPNRPGPAGPHNGHWPRASAPATARHHERAGRPQRAVPRLPKTGRICVGTVSVPPAASTCRSKLATSVHDAARRPRLNSVELGGQAGILGQGWRARTGRRQTPSRMKKANVPSGAGDLVARLLPDDALGRPTQAIPVEGHRPAQIIYAQRDEEDLRPHVISCRAVRESCAALQNLLLFSVAWRRLDPARLAGNHVIIGVGRTYTLYAHLAPGSVAARRGRQVRAGHVIGRVGHTGGRAVVGAEARGRSPLCGPAGPGRLGRWAVADRPCGICGLLSLWPLGRCRAGRVSPSVGGVPVLPAVPMAGTGDDRGREP